MSTIPKLEEELVARQQKCGELQATLNELIAQEPALIRKQGAERLAGKKNGPANNALHELRTEIEGLQSALTVATEQAQQTESELNNTRRAETEERWNALWADVKVKLARIRACVGEGGLKGALDDMQWLLRENQPLIAAIVNSNLGDQGREANTIQRICDDGDAKVWALWVALENYAQNRYGGDPQTLSPEPDGHLEGFGYVHRGG